jgi:hypothetical protein
MHLLLEYDFRSYSKGSGETWWGVDVLVVQNTFLVKIALILWLEQVSLEFLIRICFLSGLFKRIGGPSKDHIDLVIEL